MSPNFPTLNLAVPIAYIRIACEVIFFTFCEKERKINNMWSLHSGGSVIKWKMGPRRGFCLLGNFLVCWQSFF